MRPLRFQHKDGSASLVGKTVSVLAVLLIATVMYLSASPEAHEFFHHDANHEDHECVVTAFAAGEAFYVAPQIVVQPTTVVVERVELAAVGIAGETPAGLLPPVCGPPAHSLKT